MELSHKNYAHMDSLYHMIKLGNRHCVNEVKFQQTKGILCLCPL